MEKKILKWATIWSMLFTVGICAGLYVLPSVKEKIELALAMARVQEETVIEIQESITEQEQLNIELPENMDGRDITITNDYLTQTIYVRFAKAVEDYSNNYSVRGGSDHIANLSYYKDGEAGVLEINLDKVCELSYSYKDGFLCMKIINPRDVYDKIVVIDAGHGGKMPGAVKRGVYEKNINLAIVKELKQIFDEAGDKSIKVYYTRLTDVNPELEERVGLANAVDADVFISVHNNSSNSGLFNNEKGTLILYSPEEGVKQSSKRLAQICMQNVTTSAGSKDLGIVNGDNIRIVRMSEVPVSLIEVGYMTNAEEFENLQNPEYQKRVAQGIYNGIIQALEEGI